MSREEQTDQTSAQRSISEKNERTTNSTTADNLTAWLELMRNAEVKAFMESFLKHAANLFGNTPEARKAKYWHNGIMLILSFACIGTLAYMNLISDGTTGVLAGIIVGYYFKKDG
ncbi:MAG: hypothetical protein AB7F75_01195 [Planctomycetota bacterium]